MPRMDGYELASQVRNDPRMQNIPLVMVTSRAKSDKHIGKVRELRIDRLLGKPYQESELLEAVRELLPDRNRPAKIA